MRKKALALLMCAVMCIPQGTAFAEDILIEDTAVMEYENKAEETEIFSGTDETADGVSITQDESADIPYEDAEDPAFEDEIIVEDAGESADIPSEDMQDGLFAEEQEEEDIITDPETEAEGNGEFNIEGGEFEVEITVESDPKALYAHTPVHTINSGKEQCIAVSEYFDTGELCETSGKNGDRLRGAGRYVYDALEDCLADGNMDSCFISFEDTPQWQYPHDVKAYAGYSLYNGNGERHERTEQDKIVLEEDDNSIALLDTSDGDTDTYMYSIQNLVEIPVYLFLLDHPEAFRDYIFSCTLKFSYIPKDSDMTVTAALESAVVEFRPVLTGLTPAQAQNGIDAVCSNLYANADYNRDGYVEKTEYAMACYKHLKTDFEYADAWLENETQVPEEIRYAGTAVPVFFNGYGNKLICSGYADAFSIMMKWYGIPCMTVGGWDHAFNYVNLNGEWYLTDTTNGIFIRKKGESTLSWHITPMDGLRYPELSEQGLNLEWTVRTEPTCTERGKTEYWSADRFDSLQPYKTEYITAYDHDWEYSETTATCNDAGERTRTCRRCGETETFDMPSLGHDWVEISSTGKCTETRTATFICSRCGEEWTKETKGGEHRWKLTEDTASCETDGTARYVCEVCGETKEEASPATGHDYESETVTAPTCTRAGLRRSTCTNCGDIVETAIPATGHALKDVYVRRYATCTEGKLIQHICVRCGEHVGDEETEPLGHAYVTKTLKYPTCEKAGLSVRVCRRCGLQEGTESVIPARGHTWTVWKEEPATCISRAKTVYKCPVCAKFKTEYHGDPAPGHDFEDVVTKEPTCTQTGTMSKVCAVCGITSGITETIPAKGHTWNEGTVTKQPTCTQAGEKLLTCTECGETKTVSVPKTEHNLETVETVPPTCLAEGYTVFRCRDCGAQVTGDSTPKTGHQWITETVTAPTCTTDGTGVRKCSVCGLKYGDVTLERTGHSYTADEVVEATCTKGGYTHYTCSSCGAQKKDDYINALGHVYDESQAQVTEPTCTKAGTTVNTCTRCGQKTTTTTPSLGHDLKFVEKVPQTCLESGYDLMKCNRCGAEIRTNYVYVQGQGHSYKVTASAPAQIGVGGYTVRTCEYCGDTKVEYTDPLPEPTPYSPGKQGPPAPAPAVNPTISAASLKMAKGTKVTLSVSGASGKITWSTSNKKVATVSASGIVTAKKKGSCRITAKANGKTLTCGVKVAVPKLNKTSASVKRKKTVTLKVKNAKGFPVVWRSSNTAVATVTSSGKVKGIKKGSCKITAAVGGKTLTCKIKVK